MKNNEKYTVGYSVLNPATNEGKNEGSSTWNGFIFILVLLQGLCYVVDITMVFLTFIGIFDFVFHLVELYFVDERGLLLLNLP